MRRVRGKDTAPELLVRRMVHKMGLAFVFIEKTFLARPTLFSLAFTP